jgi:amino acid transporter
MPLFQESENLSEDQKKLNVVTFWLFVVALFAWVIPFTVLFVLGMMGQAVGGAGAFSFAITPSLLAFVVTAVLCVIVYYAYKRLVLKL